MILEYDIIQQEIDIHYAVLCDMYTEDSGANAIRLLRVMGQTAEVVIPDYIDGYRVVSVGEYCFSARNNCKMRIPDGEWKELENIAKEKGLRELCGDYILDIVLPDNVVRLESYAFYNCRNLKKIAFGKELKQVDNDAFMNCRGLAILQVRGQADKPTGAQYFLKQLNKEVELQFADNTDAYVRICGCFYYSEYTESYEEIGPAHIFQLDVQGEGYRARQLFDNGVIDIVRYDSIFEASRALESRYTLSRMAAGRLLYPVNLTDTAKETYIEFIKSNAGDVMSWAVKEHRLDIIEFLSSNDILDESSLKKALELAKQSGWTTGITAIIDIGNRLSGRFKKNRYEF